MLEYVVIIGLIIGASFYIISPLLKSSRTEIFVPKTDEMLTELNLKKEGVYATIRELEFDLNMGKLSEEDYEILKTQYMQNAVDCIKAIDELQMNRHRQTDQSEEDLENQIELEISTLRSSGLTNKTHMFCSQCGQKSSYKDQFCFKCGAKLIKP